MNAMGKFEKKKQNEFEDIQNVFKKRDRGRAERMREEPAPQEPLTPPRRIRQDADYSVDSMRELHEGRAVYEEEPQYVESSSVHSPRQPVYVQEPYYDGGGAFEQPRRKKRKKHRFLRGLLKAAAVLLILIILGGAASVLFARMPETMLITSSSTRNRPQLMPMRFSSFSFFCLFMMYSRPHAPVFSREARMNIKVY